MYKNKKFFALIPARGGSKRVKNKNLLEIAGKPLIGWTIEAAKNSAYIDRVIVSSENSDILESAKLLGAEIPFVRPQEFAQDHSTGMEPVLHALSEITDYDYVVLLQPTSPLRTTFDIDHAIEKIIGENAKCLVSVSPVDKKPDWMFTFKDDGRLSSLLLDHQKNKTQQVYVLNGAIYIASTKWLQNTKGFITEETIGFEMPVSRSLDIDTPEDLLFCKALMEKKFED